LELAHWFDGLNDTPAWRQLLSSRHECDVIALAHFLPYQASSGWHSTAAGSYMLACLPFTVAP
jgi:hypothetical protein